MEMLTIPCELIENIRQIIECVRKEYCPNYFDPQDVFSVNIKHLQELLEEKRNSCVEVKYIPYLKEAIENAKNYNDECGISKTEILKVWDWIWPLYKKR